MRKDQIELLDSIEKLTVNQFYLLDTPKTPQQVFLHLFGHRVLVKKSMFNKNLDKIKSQLEGTFVHSSLNVALVASYIENQIDFTEEESSLIQLIHGWVNFYPTIRSSNRTKYLLNDLVLQGLMDISQIDGFHNYLAYLNIISVDLWKIIRNKKDEKDFLAERSVKDELKEISYERNGLKLDANDLLSFVSACIPKTLLNIILTPEGLPVQLKKTIKKYECLYSNQAVEYFLKTNVKLSLLIRQIMLILLTMELNSVQQKFLLLIAIRYFYVFHFDRKYSSSEIFIHSFNKLTDEVRKSLSDELSLFFKIIIKLGKNKFTNFIAENSVFGKSIVELVRKKPMIGYPQESANPYNTAGVSEVIDIDRGATAFRTFEVFENFSIFYFLIEVPTYDITVRLYYLGEITSQKDVKTLLFTHEKSQGELKSSVNAMKKGLYMFEFDNSYSWINSKKVFYQNEIYTPLQLKTVDADEWIEDLYGNIYMNSIANQEDILVVEFKKAEAKEELLGAVYLEKEEDLFRLRLNRKGESFVYESDNIERMLQKINEYVNSKDKYKWHVNNRVIESLGEVQNFLRGIESVPSRSEGQKQRKEAIVQKKIEKIAYEEYKDDDEEDAEREPQYEVVEKQLERSQIINESEPTPIITARKSQKELTSKPEPQRKQLINCSFEQSSQLYRS